MANIWDYGSLSPFERPKYTRYELAKLVRDKRIELGLTPREAAMQYNVDEKLWKSIESASRAFNVRIYKIVADFLGMSREEILAKEIDDMAAISFRTKENNQEIEEAVQIANAIFNEMVMQEKIGVHLQ